MPVHVCVRLKYVSTVNSLFDARNGMETHLRANTNRMHHVSYRQAQAAFRTSRCGRRPLQGRGAWRDRAWRTARRAPASVQPVRKLKAQASVQSVRKSLPSSLPGKAPRWRLSKTTTAAATSEKSLALAELRGAGCSGPVSMPASAALAS